VSPATRRKRERRLVLRALAGVAPPPRGAVARWVVTLTRDAAKAMDTDNLAGAFKRARDHVAAWLGTGDAPSAPVAWRYEQRRAKAYAVGVRVEAVK